jgi:hypothetical protein
MEDCMTRESLQSLPLEELAALAREEGYEEGEAADRTTLTEFIIENLKDRAREKERENCPSIRVEDSKYQIIDPEPRAPEGQDSYRIADRYNQTKIVFMVRDPHWAFAYWEIADKTLEKLPETEEGHRLILRVHEAQSVRNPSSFDIPIQFGDSSWYIYLPEQDCGYILELGIIVEERYSCIARSNMIHTPREGVAQSLEETLQLHGDFDAYYRSGGTWAIPQRILAVGGE